MSILLTVFGFGLNATTNDVLYLVRRPGLLARSLLAMFVVMPIVSFALAKTLDFSPTVQIALVALAISPVLRCCRRGKAKPAGTPRMRSG